MCVDATLVSKKSTKPYHYVTKLVGIATKRLLHAARIARFVCGTFGMSRTGETEGDFQCLLFGLLYSGIRHIWW